MRILRVEDLRAVVEWAARCPCVCHPANKAKGMYCLSDAARDVLGETT